MIEKEYIDLEETVTTLKRNSQKYFSSFHKGYVQAIEDLADIPAAKVAPVRHGRWNKWNYAPNRKAIFLDSACEQYKTLGYPHRIILAFQCSECNMVSMVDKSHGKYDFCPNCGAKMDGKEDE